MLLFYVVLITFVQQDDASIHIYLFSFRFSSQIAFDRVFSRVLSDLTWFLLILYFINRGLYMFSPKFDMAPEFSLSNPYSFGFLVQSLSPF